MRQRLVPTIRRFILLAILPVSSTLQAQQAPPPPAAYSPAGAAALSLVVPGAGQLYTKRPALGAAFLGAAAGALAFGLLSERVTTECLARPESGACPPDQVLRTTTERPHLDAGVVGAIGVALLSAVDAFHSARSLNAHSGIRVAAPAVEVDGSRVRVSLVRITF